jgi:hypothetical protein
MTSEDFIKAAERLSLTRDDVLVITVESDYYNRCTTSITYWEKQLAEFLNARVLVIPESMRISILKRTENEDVSLTQDGKEVRRIKLKNRG